MRFKFLLFLFFITSNLFAQSSVLAKGSWIKIGIKETGVYKLDAAFFKKANVETKNLNLQNIQVFTGQIGELPQKNNSPRTTDLTEMPVFCKDSDNKFDKDDYLLFYGVSSHAIYFDSLTKTFSHSLNSYSDSSFYFINLTGNISKRIQNLTTSGAATKLSESLNYFEFREPELKNVLNSGRKWLGEFFFNFLDANISIPDLDLTEPLIFSTRVLGVGRTTQKLSLSAGNEVISKSELLPSTYNSNDNYARYNRFSNYHDVNLTLKPNTNTINIKYSLATENSANAGAYLDYYTINCKRKLSYDFKNQRIYKQIPENNQIITKLKVNNIDPNTGIWSIDDKTMNPINLDINNTNEVITKPSSQGASIVIFNKSTGLTPRYVSKVINQNIKENPTPQLILVYPPKFKVEAEVLSVHKKKNMNLEVLTLSTAQVYNEFSGGKVDPTAIRDLCKFFWNKDPNTFKYLLILGDASFDFKNNNRITYINTANLIPTYQSSESLEPIFSFSSDDYFGFLENNEGEWAEGYSQDNYWISNDQNDHTLDIAVGRLPAKDVFEAKALVNKIINYELYGKKTQDWKNKITFIADNRDFNIHQRDAEKLSQLAQISNAGFEINKIYLDAYKIEGTKQDPRVPSATQAIAKAVDEGSFLVNYNGHGSEDGWAQEKLLTNLDIQKWQNKDNLPIFFTATCQFGKFDNPAVVSGAELTILNPFGGAIALLTTTRPVYSSTNEKINNAFYANFTNAKTIGELFVLTKNASIEGEINRNFSLLGDPSIQLPNFQKDINVISINSKDPTNQSFNALQTIEIKGKSLLIKNGKVKIEIFDKPYTQKTLGSFTDSEVFEYQKRNNKILEGVFEIKNNFFNSNFIIPKNIIEGNEKGKIVLFGINEDSTIQTYGLLDDFLIFPKSITNQTDVTPPTVLVTIDNDITIGINIKDESGIKVSDLNDAQNLKLIINDTLLIDLKKFGVFSAGNSILDFKIKAGYLPNGKHQCKIIVSDVYNNSTIQTFEININKPKFLINNLILYPNPIIDVGTLKLNHNRQGDDLEVMFELFNITGQQIFKETYPCFKCGTEINFGIDFTSKLYPNAQYFYKLTLLSKTENIKSQSTGRFIFWK